MSYKIRVLIVDDNPGMLRTTAMILGRKGYSVEVAEDGAAAIEMVYQMDFDVVLMDIKMPRLNGVDAFKQIKGIRPGVIVILMTAYAVDELIEEGLQAGAHGVLYKPLDMDQTFELIEKVQQERNGLLLLVEDDTGLSRSMHRLLEKQGYSIDIAHDGETAIDLARKRQYDALIIDINLPVLNGLQTYLAIREINPDVVAIIITGYRDEMGGLAHLALESGAYACLYKPLDFQQVFKLLTEIV